MATIKIELKKRSYNNHTLPITVEDYKKALQLARDKTYSKDYSGKESFHEEDYILEVIWNIEVIPEVSEK